MTAEAYDVCVLGGGPAGSALALRLAQLGNSVCLVERQPFPRRRIGESLSPGTWDLLDSLGAREAVEASGFTPCREVLLHWQPGPPERRSQRQKPGLLVDRGRFDALLLRLAQAHGVTVLQPASVLRQEEQAGGWHLDIALPAGRRSLTATLLADATGRAGGRRRRTGPRSLALFGYWRGERLPPLSRIEAAEAAWLWGMPLPDGSYNAMAFVDLAAFRRERRESGATPAAIYHRLIARSGLLEDALGLRLDGAVQAADASPSYRLDAIGPRRIAVGAAALAIDPLSSSGVQKSLQTALAGAIAVHTLLHRPAQAPAAQAFYQDNIRASAERHQRWAADFYRSAAAGRDPAFWRERSQPALAGRAVMPPAPLPPGRGLAELPVRWSPAARWVDRPCILGSFIETRPALEHPGLEEPAAFFGGRELAPLLGNMAGAETTPLALAKGWSPHLPLASGLALAGWLLGAGVLQPASSG